MAALWWVVAALVMGVCEVLLPALVFGTLVVAALAGAVASWLGGDFRVQAVTASVVALVLLALVRPLLVKRFPLQGRFIPSGTAAAVGRPARVLADVSELGGRVKISGEEWSARSSTSGEVFPTGTTVQVVAIDGATAVVTAVPGPSPGPPSGPAGPPPGPPGTPEEPRL